MKMFLRIQLALLGILVFVSVSGQNLRMSFHFEQPAFIERFDEFSEPVMANTINLGEEGFPLLPAFGAQFLLPQGKEIESVKIISVNYSEKINGITIVPASRQFPISARASKDYRPFPNPDIYQSTGHYPDQIISDISTQFLGGFSVAVFNIWPMQFHPAEKSVLVINSVEVEIITRDVKNNPVKPAYLSQTTLDRIERLVSNPEMARSYPINTLRDEEQVDLLIITNQNLSAAFQAYINYKTERGFLTEIITTEEIYSNYPGSDNQEKIRNCIRFYYENRGLVYVILGGDSDTQNQSQRIVPHRGFYVDTGFGTLDEDIPSDLYYACLDGSWDNNGNGKFGEPGEEDLFAEVIIGRMCVDSNTEIQNMTLKLMKYQDTPVIADIQKALMVGEQLDSSTWGGNYKEEVANGSSNNGYTTSGIPPSFSVSRLYEMNGNWNKSDIFNQFNNIGINLLNHLGHSYVDYNMKMDLSDLTITNFQNNGVNRGYVIGYSQGCYNGSYDNRGSSGGYSGTDCFAERITTMETAMVASLSNSRYGWYAQNSTNGASQVFDRKFFDAIFGKGISEIGTANGDSKEDNVSWILNNRVIRWCAYEVTLFGDPGMPIWTAPPTPIAATYPSTVPIGLSSIVIETDAPGARIGVSQNGELLGRAIADANGNASIEFMNIVGSGASVIVSITAHNRSLHQGVINVMADMPYVVADYFTISDANGNNNGIVEFGEQITLGLGMKNLGNLPADDVVVTLGSTDNYITLSYLAVEFGNIGPGQTVYIEDAFPVIISGNTPDQHQVQISVNANGSSTWVSTVKFKVNSPVIIISDMIIDDTTGGNGNGRLDQGEEVIFRFTVDNNGHALSPDLLMQLVSNNSNVNITSSQVTHTGLQIGGNCILVFTGTVDPDAVMGDLASLQATITSGQYQVIKNYTLKIGMIIEGFESADFSLINWEFSGSQPWSICQENPQEGIFCARSGAITHEQSSELKISVFVAQQDTISFYRKVASESGKDFLRFYDGGMMRGEWSGVKDWERVSYTVYPGYHEFRWVYEKDDQNNNYEDCAWIDYIRFPKLLESKLDAGGDDMVCIGDNYQTKSSGIYLMAIQWVTSGTGTFSDPGILQPIYTPSAADIQNGWVTLSVSAYGANNQPLNDSMILEMVDEPGIPAKPTGEIQVCTNYGTTYQYTTPEIPQVRAYIWELQPANAGTWVGNEHVVNILWTPDFTGNITLKVKGVNPCGESIFSETLEITASICTGIEDKFSDGISIFPNPGNGIFWINLPENIVKAELKVYNASGQDVFGKSIEIQNDAIEINLKNQVPGIYFVRITSEGKSYIEKIILE